jgi:hypothetical protein
VKEAALRKIPLRKRPVAFFLSGGRFLVHVPAKFMKIPVKFFLALLVISLSLAPGISLAESESGIRQFLYDPPGVYGWTPVGGDKSYDFFKDGRLHVQGPDGEATMWGGTWKLKGDRLTLKVPDLKVNATYTVTIDGDDLLLDGQRYRRGGP